MLRPKKNISRKEIQRDPFLESVDQAQVHLEKNRSMYTGFGVAVVGLLIVFNISNSKKKTHAIKASASLGQALISLDKNDDNTAKFQLETVNSEYKKTPSGHLSNYYLGKMKFDSGLFEESEKYLNNFLKNNSNDYLLVPSYLMLSDIKMRDGQIEQAIKMIDKGLRKVESPNEQISLKLRKAHLVLKNGDKTSSRLIIDDILDEKDLISEHKKVAEEIFGKLTS